MSWWMRIGSLELKRGDKVFVDDERNLAYVFAPNDLNTPKAIIERKTLPENRVIPRIQHFSYKQDFDSQVKIERVTYDTSDRKHAKAVSYTIHVHQAEILSHIQSVPKTILSVAAQAASF